MARKLTGKPPGRPSIYTPELGAEVARRYASGTALRVISDDPDMPDQTTISRWKKEDRGGFASLIARARAAKAEVHAERPDARYQEAEDYLLAKGEDGKPVNDVGRAKARVGLADKRDNYDRWLAGCLDPDTYGDRTKIDLTGSVRVLHAFSDLGAAAAIQAEARIEDEGPALPHVTVPDGADDQDQVE